MKKYTKGFLQVGLVIVVASLFAAGLLVNKLRFDSSSATGFGGCSDITNCTGWTHIPGVGYCPTGAPDACDTLGSYTCVKDPYVSKCVLFSSKCPVGSQYAYQFDTWYATTEELMKDPRCSGSSGGTNNCIVTSDPITECKQAGNCTGAGAVQGGDCEGLDIYGKQKKLCTYTIKTNICTPTPTSYPTKPPIITPSPTPTRSPSPTPTRSPSPTPTRSPSPTPSRSPSPTPTRSPSPSPTPKPGTCKITFVPSDHQAVCWKDVKTFTVTYKVDSLPTNGVYYMQTNWYVASPNVGPNHYKETQRIYAGNTYTFTADWPGVTGQPLPNNVDVQLGLNVVDSNHNLITPNCSKGLDYYWTPYVCKFTTPSPSPTPSRSPSPKPSKSPSPTPSAKPSKSPSPTPSHSPSSTPTFTPSPSATPIQTAKLKVCKYNDSNNNGQLDSGEGTMSWKFFVKYQDTERTLSTPWWNFFSRGCVTTEVPLEQWINVSEEGRSNWNLTGIYQDGSWVGKSDYNYVAVAGQQKTVTFLNYYLPNSTPAPTGEPNSCNGTCGSNYNCKGGFFCYIESGKSSGFCRNPACSSDSSCNCGLIPTPRATAPPVVLGATAPPILPKTGSNTVEVALGLTSLVGTGFYLFRKFRLV